MSRIHPEIEGSLMELGKNPLGTFCSWFAGETTQKCEIPSVLKACARPFPGGSPWDKCHSLAADREALCGTGFLIKDLNQSQESGELPFGLAEPQISPSTRHCGISDAISTHHTANVASGRRAQN